MPEAAVRDVPDRPRTFFPSQITAYRRCPERYFLQYIEKDALDVASWTQTALDMLPRDARPMLVEKNLYAPVGRGPVQLGARIDLVLQHDDGTIEHVDFKTGKLREDPV